jgi:hypothetical protein
MRPTRKVATPRKTRIMSSTLATRKPESFTRVWYQARRSSVSGLTIMSTRGVPSM